MSLNQNKACTLNPFPKIHFDSPFIKSIFYPIFDSIYTLYTKDNPPENFSQTPVEEDGGDFPIPMKSRGDDDGSSDFE